MKSRSRDGLAAKGLLVPVWEIIHWLLVKWSVIGLSWIHLFFLFHQTWKHKHSLVAHRSNHILSGLSKRLRVAGEINYGKSNRGDFLFLFFLMLVKLSYAALIRVDSESCRLLAYFDNPTYYILNTTVVG